MENEENLPFEIDEALERLLVTLFGYKTYLFYKNLFELLSYYNIPADTLILSEIVNNDIDDSEVKAYIVSYTKDKVNEVLENNYGVALSKEGTLEQFYKTLYVFNVLEDIDVLTIEPLIKQLEDDTLEDNDKLIGLISTLTTIDPYVYSSVIEYIQPSKLNAIIETLSKTLEIIKEANSEDIINQMKKLAILLTGTRYIMKTKLYSIYTGNEEIEDNITLYSNDIMNNINHYLNGTLTEKQLAVIIVGYLLLYTDDYLSLLEEYKESVEPFILEEYDLKTTETIAKAVKQYINKLIGN